MRGNPFADQQPDPNAELRAMMKGMLDKLKAAMDEGPDAPDVILSPAEAALAYRLIMER